MIVGCSLIQGRIQLAKLVPRKSLSHFIVTFATCRTFTHTSSILAVWPQIYWAAQKRTMRTYLLVELTLFCARIFNMLGTRISTIFPSNPIVSTKWTGGDGLRLPAYLPAWLVQCLLQVTCLISTMLASKSKNSRHALWASFFASVDFPKTKRDATFLTTWAILAQVWVPRYDVSNVDSARSEYEVGLADQNYSCGPVTPDSGSLHDFHRRFGIYPTFLVT